MLVVEYLFKMPEALFHPQHSEQLETVPFLKLINKINIIDLSQVSQALQVMIILHLSPSGLVLKMKFYLPSSTVALEQPLCASHCIQALSRGISARLQIRNTSFLWSPSRKLCHHFIASCPCPLLMQPDPTRCRRHHPAIVRPIKCEQQYLPALNSWESTKLVHSPRDKCTFLNLFK